MSDIQDKIDARRARGAASMAARGWSFPKDIAPLGLLYDIEAENLERADEIEQLRENIATWHIAEHDDAMSGRSTRAATQEECVREKIGLRMAESDGLATMTVADAEQLRGQILAAHLREDDARTVMIVALREAGIDTADPAAGVRELAAQRDEARAETEAVRSVLEPVFFDGLGAVWGATPSEVVSCVRALVATQPNRFTPPSAPPKEPAPEPRQSNCMACGGSGVQSDALTGAVWDCICRKPRPAPEPRGNGPVCPSCGWTNDTLRKRCRNCSADLVMHPDPEIDHEVRMDADDGRRSTPVPAPEPAPEPRQPKCPTCDRRLRKVTQDTGSPLNAEQFDAGKAGDWYCDTCPPHVDRKTRANVRYWWDRELAKPVPAPEPAPPLMRASDDGYTLIGRPEPAPEPSGWRYDPDDPLPVRVPAPEPAPEPTEGANDIVRHLQLFQRTDHRNRDCRQVQEALRIAIALASEAVPAPEPAPEPRDESVPPPGWQRQTVRHRVESGEDVGCERQVRVTSSTALAWKFYDAEHGYAPDRAAIEAAARADERAKVRAAIADKVDAVLAAQGHIEPQDLRALILAAPVCRCGHDRGSHGPQGKACECCTEPGGPRCACFTVAG